METTGGDNRQAQGEQRDVPAGEEARRSWASVLASDANQVGTTLAGAAALYGAKKAADKIRKPPPPDPDPCISQGGGDDAGPEAGGPS